MGDPEVARARAAGGESMEETAGAYTCSCAAVQDVEARYFSHVLEGVVHVGRSGR